MKRTLNLGSLSRIVEGEILKVWDGVNEAANALNLNHSNISAALTKSGRHRTCGGYKWEYYETITKEDS